MSQSNVLSVVFSSSEIIEYRGFVFQYFARKSSGTSKFVTGSSTNAYLGQLPKGLCQPIVLQNCCRKLHENERILTGAFPWCLLGSTTGKLALEMKYSKHTHIHKTGTSVIGSCIYVPRQLILSLVAVRKCGGFLSARNDVQQLISPGYLSDSGKAYYCVWRIQ